MTINVFVSAGRTSTAEQQTFLDGLQAVLLHNQLNPMLVLRNVWSAKRPLLLIDEVMRTCDGAVILAFERFFVEKGTELRGDPKNARSLDGQRITTVWNQIEAGMAHASKLPLLVVVEEGLRTDGLLEHSNDWYILEVPLAPATFQDPRFRGVLDDWKRTIEANVAAKTLAAAAPAIAVQPATTPAKAVEPDKVALSAILRSLSTPQAFGLLSAIFAILGGVAYAGYWFATHQPMATAGH